MLAGAFDDFGGIVEEERRFGLRADALLDEIEIAGIGLLDADAGGIEDILEKLGQAEMAPESVGAQVFLISGNVETASA
jgi:hypothetical protein